MSTLRFACRADKPDKFGKCPIELIYQVSGQRKKIFLPKKFKVYASLNWSAKSQQATYISPTEARRVLAKELHKFLDAIIISEFECNEINDEIKSVQVRIAEIEKRFVANKILYSAASIISEFNNTKTGETKKDDHRDQVPDYIDLYIETHTPNRAAGSLNVYRALKRHLIGYRENKKQLLIFEAIDYQFIHGLQSYLIKQGKLNNTTIAKVLKTLKALLAYAKMNGLKVNDSFRDFKIKSEKLEVIALTEPELNSLIKMDLSDNKRLDQVRDIFVFSCTTGLRASDMQNLRRENIKADHLSIKVKKTKTDLNIPLNKISAGILRKYRDSRSPLPMISTQNLNQYIKELCDKAGINEPIEIVRFRGSAREEKVFPKYELIHLHTGRKTFCTLSLEKGMSAEEVMEMGGWSDYRSFQRYVNVTEARKKLVMIKAWGDIPKLKVV